jgi:hypothetical protein
MVYFVYALLLFVLHDDNTWIINELHPTILLVPVYTKKHYTIQSLAVLMRILLKILTNLNLMDTQTQLPDNSMITNIS